MKSVFKKYSGKHNCLSGLLIFTIIVNLSFLAFRVFFTSRLDFNSDAATLSLYAEEIVKTGRLFPPGWGYNNGDIWLYDNVAFLVPLLKIFHVRNGYSAYAISTVLTALFILSGLWLGLRMLKVRDRAAVAAVSVFASGIASPFIANLLYDWGGSYGTDLLLAFLQLVSLINITDYLEKKATNIRLLVANTVLFCIFVFISALSNASRALLYNFFPYIVAFGLSWYQQEKRRGFERSVPLNAPSRMWLSHLAIMALFLLAFVLGAYCNHQVAGDATGLAKPTIYPVGSLMSNLDAIVKSWLFLFGYPANSVFNHTGMNVDLMSALGVYISMRIALALALSLVIIMFVRKAIRALAAKQRISMVVAVPVIGFLTSLFIHVTSFRYPSSGAYLDYTSIRYLFVPLMLILISSIVIFNKDISIIFNKGRNVLIFFFFIIGLGFMNHVYPAITLVGIKTFNYPMMGLVSCLEQHGLRYGYGGFWSANVYSVLSASKVKVRPVIYSGRRIDRFPFHSSASWYEPSSWQGKSFLLLSSSEDRDVNQKWLADTLGKRTRVFTCDKFRVLEYNYNVSENLFGNIKDIPIFFDKLTPHVVGSVDVADDEIRAKAGERGYVLYGPYIPAKKGKYRVTMSIYSSTETRSRVTAGIIDVVANEGNRLLAKTAVETQDGWQSIALSFDLDSNVNDLEFRVFSNGAAPVWVRGPVRIVRESPQH